MNIDEDICLDCDESYADNLFFELHCRLNVCKFKNRKEKRQSNESSNDDEK